MTGGHFAIGEDLIEKGNKKVDREVKQDFDSLGRKLSRKRVDINKIIRTLKDFKVAVPSWGMISGGTRFGSFPLPGRPRNVFEKLQDVSTVNRLTRVTPRVSLHIPWDKTDDYTALKRYAKKLGLSFDAMNSNTFQDQPEQKHSYKYGSLSHTSKLVREQAVAHNLEVIDIGKKVGSKAITIWIADGSNFPGQTSLGESFERYMESLHRIYKALPEDWNMFIEYKPFEPAFYYTVLADWGSALIASQEVGEKCKVLVDLGHHLPGTNIEAIVARLIGAGKLGGFHLNDNHYADDDLTTASIYPYRLFRIFHELIIAGIKQGGKFSPAYMIDQSHNLEDPIEALIQTVTEMQNIWAKALLVDHNKLQAAQKTNDVLIAEMVMKDAFNTDVRPLTAMARREAGGAIDPITVYRESGYRKKAAMERKGDL